MARLVRGENPKIDQINDWVDMALSEDKSVSEEGLENLLEMFKPLLIKLCNKWAKYFDDLDHSLIAWDIIIADSQFWFIKYTKEKYTVDGASTYNNFIKDHMNQRIRYIYECELNYRKKHIFPDPDKRNDEDTDMFDDVVFNYSSSVDYGDFTENMIDDEYNRNINKLHDKILSLIGDERYFSQRDAKILIDSMIHGKTHEKIGEELGISRTRVSQLMSKIKRKLQDIIMENEEYWEVR